MIPDPSTVTILLERSMRLSTSIDPKLWSQLEATYEAKNYKAAIMEAFHYLSDLIRDKSGLDGDGTQLVGNAFGGKNPLLKINKCETESERNIQQGTEAILRGLYQSIRNPRSHGIHHDSQRDCDSIVQFIDFMLAVVDKSPSVFDKESVMRQIFDGRFVAGKRYADLVVAEIPFNKRWDVLVEAYRRKDNSYWRNIGTFFNTLISSVSSEERTAFLRIVSDELKVCTSDEAVATVVHLVSPPHWNEIAERSRLRAENILNESVRDAYISREDGRCVQGFYGQWIQGIAHDMILRDQLAAILSKKLRSGDWGHESYVLSTLFSTFVSLRPVPTAEDVQRIQDALEAGDHRFQEALGSLETSLTSLSLSWKEPFQDRLWDFRRTNVGGLLPPEPLW